MRKVLLVLFIVSILVANYLVITNGINTYGDSETDYIEYSVQQGDTLWSIAKRYSPDDLDIREYIYYIEKFNSLENTVIKRNQILKLPIIE